VRQRQDLPRRRPDRLHLHLRRRLDPRLPVRVDLGLDPAVAADLPHFGSSCASQQMRPERSTS